MGSATSFLGAVPQDYSRCTDSQLQQIINTSIISLPWYDDKQLEEHYRDHLKWHNRSLELNIVPSVDEVCLCCDRQCDTIEEFALHTTISEMKKKGYRPISILEYRRFLLKYPSPTNRNKIKLWVSDCSIQQHLKQEQKTAEFKTAEFNNVYYSQSEGHFIRMETSERGSEKISCYTNISLPCSKENLTEVYHKVGDATVLDIAHFKSEEDAACVKVDSQCETEEWPKLY